MTNAREIPFDSLPAGRGEDVTSEMIARVLRAPASRIRFIRVGGNERGRRVAFFEEVA